MKLTEKVREFIPKAGCCMLKRCKLLPRSTRRGDLMTWVGANHPLSGDALRLGVKAAMTCI